jgi:hypothetical protein
MRLVSRTFFFALLLLQAAPAIAQPGGNYEPPPVDYADAAAPAPVAAPPPASGVSYDPPPVDYAAGPSSEAGALNPAPQSLVQPEATGSPESGRRGRHGRVNINAYVEANAGVSAELHDSGNLLGGDDTVTYTSVAAGVEGQVNTRHVVANFGYRYERQIELQGGAPDRGVHTGIAEVNAQLTPNLSVEAGGLATRSGGNGRAVGATIREDGAQIVSAYAGSTVSTHAGPVSVNAYYRLGYVHVDDDGLVNDGNPEGSFSATNHMAGVTVQSEAANGRVGWTVSAGHYSEVAGTFDSHYQQQFVRGDVAIPVNPTLALTAGVGYGRERSSQLNFLRDAGGAPVIDAQGNLVADHVAPRLPTNTSEGVFADAGFIYRPTRRSELQLRAGINNDGDPIVAGSAHFALGRAFGFSFSLYDNDETFGRSLIRNLRDLPDNFTVRTDQLTGNLAAGCVFDRNEPGRGVCLSPVLQSLTSVSYRARGGSLLFSGGRRLWTLGGGITFAQRDYYLPDDPIFADVFAPSDSDLAIFGSAGRRLGRNADIDFSTFVSLYSTDALIENDVTTIGGRVTYSRSFLMSRLQAVLGLGLTYRSFSIDPSSLVADLMLGIRYNF